MLTRTMPDLRQSVCKELERRKWTAYRLIKELEGKRANGDDVPPMTVRGFLRGKSTINSGDLGLIFDVLSLELKRKR